ncbi:MAG: hypothetical protein NT168_16820 [Planctomycetota bacterium]|nr:hypothetical protein [Planctomycetota bacterium]
MIERAAIPQQYLARDAEHPTDAVDHGTVLPSFNARMRTNTPLLERCV